MKGLIPMSKKVFFRLFTATVFISMLTIYLSSCGSNRNTNVTNNAPTGDIDMPQLNKAPITELPQVWLAEQYEAANMADEFKTRTLLQLTPLYVGELLVTMHTTMGDITMRFFPSEAPTAVENFLTHAWNGYYDGIIFHRVINQFMVQTGCPLGNGTGGESIWGSTFGHEKSSELRHFRGALAMAQTQMPNSIGSQFYIVQNTALDQQMLNQFNSLLEFQDDIMEEFDDGSHITFGDVFTAESLLHFIENGGTPHLDWHFNQNFHTVFAHVVHGMDVVDAIAAVPVVDPAAQNFRPIDDIRIINFSFFTYQGQGGV